MSETPKCHLCGKDYVLGVLHACTADFGPIRTPSNPLTKQEGGGHYVKCAIQPIEYIHANNLPFIEGNIVKYITRWRDKNGIQDLEKIKHYVDLLIELETRK